MSRLLFIASIVMILVKVLTYRAPRPKPDVVIDAPGFVHAGQPWFQVSALNFAAREAWVRGCGDLPAIAIQHHIAGRWYMHRRAEPACADSTDWGLLRDRRLRAKAMIGVPGRYRLVMFYRLTVDAPQRVAYSNVITVLQPRFAAQPPSQLSTAPTGASASPPSSR